MTCLDCGSDKIEANGRCASCNHAMRKAERQASKVKIVQPIRKVAPKRAAQNAEYTKLRKEYLALYPVCEDEECEEPSTEIHHQNGRWGGLLLDANYFMAVCRKHHTQYTEHSKEAIEKGYSIKRTNIRESNDQGRAAATSIREKTASRR